MKKIQFKTFKITRQITGYVFILIPLKFDTKSGYWKGIAIGDSSKKYGEIHTNTLINPYDKDYKIL